MHILQVNKYHFVNGGGDRYFLELSQQLERSKHKTAVFSMNNTLNSVSSWSKYFVDDFSVNQANLTDFMRFGRIIYSVEARRKLSHLLDVFPADIAHIHSIYHHLSPSILPELNKRNIPAVMTVHDYHLIAPNYNLFHNGKICEITRKSQYYKAIYHKCVKDSFPLSLAEVLEKYVHLILGWERKMIKVFIAPSLFLKRKLVEYGIPDKKIVHLPYFIDLSEYKAQLNSGDYVLYFGRLAEEKGLSLLIEAFKKLTHIKLLIAGTGPLENKLKAMVNKSNLSNIRFLGYLNSFNLKKAIGGCRFTVLPSLWYDIAPLAILESFACGKPVVATNIGGIPETVRHKKNGILFKAGDLDEFTEKVNHLWQKKNSAIRMGRDARKDVEVNHDFKSHYQKLLAIYQNTPKS